MIDGVMLLWFGLTAMSLLFVAIYIRTTPESPVLKWGFVLLTAYIGPTCGDPNARRHAGGLFLGAGNRK
jgi:hypothetical protein